MPVFEDVQMGMATGLALLGFVPITCYPRFDFLILSMNQLVNHLDKIRIMSNIFKNYLNSFVNSRFGDCDIIQTHLRWELLNPIETCSKCKGRHAISLKLTQKASQTPSKTLIISRISGSDSVQFSPYPPTLQDVVGLGRGRGEYCARNLAGSGPSGGRQLCISARGRGRFP